MGLETGVKLLDEAKVLGSTDFDKWPVVHTWEGEDFFVIEHGKTSLVVTGNNIEQRPWHVWQDVERQTGKKPKDIVGRAAVSYIYAHVLLLEQKDNEQST